MYKVGEWVSSRGVFFFFLGIGVDKNVRERFLKSVVQAIKRSEKKDGGENREALNSDWQ